MFEFLKKIINKASPEKKPAAKKEVVKKAVKKTSSAPKKIVAKAPILPKKKKAKEPKKSTVQETYELWQQHNSIQEIAKIRVLTPQTIQGHLAKLIEAKTISISDVFSENKIKELAAAFEGYNEETLNALKEQVGEKFTWGELRLFKASL